MEGMANLEYFKRDSYSRVQIMLSQSNIPLGAYYMM